MKMGTEKEIKIKISEFNHLIDALETLQIISELDPVRNSAEDYRDAICAILEMRGWR